MNRTSAVFCLIVLAGFFVVAALLVPLASLPEETFEAANTPTPAENLEDVDVGRGFGTVPVAWLLDYYLDNPPAPEADNQEAERMPDGC